MAKTELYANLKMTGEHIQVFLQVLEGKERNFIQVSSHSNAGSALIGDTACIKKN